MILQAIECAGVIEITLPIVTVSEANRHEHWSVASKRHKNQKKAVYAMLKPLASRVNLPCTLSLTRYAPGLLDKHDNLRIALKWVVDACCAVITNDYRAGRADNNEQITIEYDQVKNKSYGVKIKII